MSCLYKYNTVYYYARQKFGVCVVWSSTRYFKWRGKKATVHIVRYRYNWKQKKTPTTAITTTEKCCCGFCSRNNYNIVKLISMYPIEWRLYADTMYNKLKKNQFKPTTYFRPHLTPHTHTHVILGRSGAIEHARMCVLVYQRHIKVFTFWLRVTSENMHLNIQHTWIHARIVFCA